MAESPSHKFGQILGDVVESSVLPLLENFANGHKLYLDRKGHRPCRVGVKCSWVDHNRNSHDLDFVMERGGSLIKKGLPVAFIEVAWRRYTKHSRNKVQEIQGAIEPLAETYRNVGPFKGAILAGVFTEGALTQLKSLGFTVLYFPYGTIVQVFLKYGINAFFDEKTPDAEFQKKVVAYTQLSPADRTRLAEDLLNANQLEVTGFIKSLTAAVSRQIERIIILPLHGTVCEWASVEDAIKFVQGYAEEAAVQKFVRYEVQIRYNNGNEITGEFGDKESAIQFLRSFMPPAE